MFLAFHSLHCTASPVQNPASPLFGDSNSCQATWRSWRWSAAILGGSLACIYIYVCVCVVGIYIMYSICIYRCVYVYVYIYIYITHLLATINQYELYIYTPCYIHNNYPSLNPLRALSLPRCWSPWVDPSPETPAPWRLGPWSGSRGSGRHRLGVGPARRIFSERCWKKLA